jgi:hypothetical protein
MALPAYKQNEHRRLATPAVALSLNNSKCINHSYSNKCIIIRYRTRQQQLCLLQSNAKHNCSPLTTNRHSSQPPAAPPLQLHILSGVALLNTGGSALAPSSAES